MSFPTDDAPTTTWAPSTEVASADLNAFKSIATQAKINMEAGGNVVQESHRWGPVGVTATTSDLVSYLGFAASAPANTGIDVQPGDYIAPVRHDPKLRLIVGAAATTEMALVVQDYAGGGYGGPLQPISNLDDIVAVMEYSAHVESAVQIGVSYVSGFTDYQGGGTAATMLAAANRLVAFAATPAAGNWSCVVANGVGVTTALSSIGLSATVSQVALFRIELHGVNTPVGVAAGNAVARFYIDGILESEIDDANVPTGDPSVGAFHSLGAVLGGPGVSRTYFVGTTRVAWGY